MASYAFTLTLDICTTKFVTSVCSNKESTKHLILGLMADVYFSLGFHVLMEGFSAHGP